MKTVRPAMVDVSASTERRTCRAEYRRSGGARLRLPELSRTTRCSRHSKADHQHRNPRRSFASSSRSILASCMSVRNRTAQRLGGGALIAWRPQTRHNRFMGKIKSVTVRRFKRLQELSLTLDDVTLLIGANNAGKSTVLQALHFAVSLAQTARLVGVGLSWAKGTFQLSFNPAQLLYSPVADVMALATGGQLQEPAASRTEIELTSEAGPSCTVALRRGRNRNIQVTIEGRELGEQLMNIEQPFTVYAPGLAGIAKEERYLSPGVVRRIVARGDANLVLRNVLRMLDKDPSQKASFIQDMSSIFPGFAVSISFNEETDENIDARISIGSGPELPIDAAGTSVLQASQILAYVTLFKPQLLILDEPDSHLHPDNQRALCDLVAKLSVERSFQALVSTHSRHVLDAMTGRSALIWLSKGSVVTEPDGNATKLLLELGALDSVDYFADGRTKTVIASEDADKAPIKALVEAAGFPEDGTEVVSYAGCSKTEAAVVLGKFLRDKAPGITVIVHRDRDYSADEAVSQFEKDLKKAGVTPFVTEVSDVEGYFLNAQHLHYANPSVSAERIQELIEQATLETRDKSVAAIINLRTQGEFQRLRGTGKSPNTGEIALQAIKDYEANPSAMRRGKLVIGPLTAKLQAEIKANPNVYVVSPHLKVPGLEAVAKKTPLAGAPVPSAPPATPQSP